MQLWTKKALFGGKHSLDFKKCNTLKSFYVLHKNERRFLWLSFKSSEATFKMDSDPRRHWKAASFQFETNFSLILPTIYPTNAFEVRIIGLKMLQKMKKKKLRPVFCKTKRERKVGQKNDGYRLKRRRRCRRLRAPSTFFTILAFFLFRKATKTSESSTGPAEAYVQFQLIFDDLISVSVVIVVVPGAAPWS